MSDSGNVKISKNCKRKVKRLFIESVAASFLARLSRFLRVRV